MSNAPDRHRLSYRVLAIIGVFVFLNRFFIGGDLAGLLDAAWGRPLTWGLLAGGVIASVVLVEFYRRRRGVGRRWFAELFAIMAGVVIINEVVGLLDALLGPVLRPAFEATGLWGIFLVLSLSLVLLVWASRRVWNKHLSSGETTTDGR